MKTKHILSALFSLCLLFALFSALPTPARAQLPLEVQVEILMEQGKGHASKGNWPDAYNAYAELFRLNVPVPEEAYYYYAQALSECLFFIDAKNELSLYFEHADRNTPTYRAALKLAAYLNEMPSLDYHEHSFYTKRTRSLEELIQAKIDLAMYFLHEEKKPSEAEKWFHLAAKDGSVRAIEGLFSAYAYGRHGFSRSMEKGRALALQISSMEFSNRSDNDKIFPYYLYFMRNENWMTLLIGLAREGNRVAEELCDFSMTNWRSVRLN